MDKIVSLCKRRGFVYPSSEIYGGMANIWDFGHYGVLLKNNLRDLWWKKFVLTRSDMVGIEASIILHPNVWNASGHVKGFVDSLVECRNCHFRIRADHLIENKVSGIKAEGMTVQELSEIIKTNNIACPKCGKRDFTDARKFNLLLKTHLGVIEGGQSVAYLRGEIAQGIFINFKNVVNTMRVKIPFGIAQQGKAFRNEITLGQFIHRTLEFDLMEFEYFVNPSQGLSVFEYWKKEMWNWAISLGLDINKLRWREHEEKERAHYSEKTEDIEYQYPFGWAEMFGLAYRTDYDLKNHSTYSKVDLSYIDPYTKERYFPHVVEPAFGLSRLTGIVITDAYHEEEVDGKLRVYLKLHPHIAPIKIAIFPLQKDEKLEQFAKNIYSELKGNFICEFDDTGNIGKMYRRQDEIGTPFCVTIDYQTLDDKTITVRHRDTMKQERIPLENLKQFFEHKLM